MSVINSIESKLSSPLLANQIEAITIATHFIKTSSDLLQINVLLHRFADIFVDDASKEIRYHIAKAVKECASAIQTKFLSADEFISRVCRLLISNDWESRTICLVLLGAIPQFILPRVDVHHQFFHILTHTKHPVE